jgi:hypothetical protein
MVKFTTSPTLSSADLTTYIGEKMAEGHSMREINRHVAAMKPRPVFLHIEPTDGHNLPYLRLPRDTLPSLQGDMMTQTIDPFASEGLRHLWAAQIAYMRANACAASGIPDDWFVTTGSQVMSEYFGEPLTLRVTNNTTRSQWDVLVDVGSRRLTMTRPLSRGNNVLAMTLANANNWMPGASTFDTYCKDLTTATLYGENPTKNTDLCAAYVPGPGVDTVVRVAASNDVTTGHPLWATLMSSITAMCPAYNYATAMTAYQTAQAASPTYTLGSPANTVFLPGLYAWGVADIIEELKLTPVNEFNALNSPVPVPVSDVSNVRAGETYIRLTAIMGVEFSLGTFKDAALITRQDLIDENLDPAEADDMILELTGKEDVVVCSNILGTSLIGPSLPLSKTKLNAHCNKYDFDLMSEVYSPATNTEAAVTFGQADRRSSEVTSRQFTVSFKAAERWDVLSDAYVTPEPGHSVVFDMSTSGVDPDVVSVVSPLLVNRWGSTVLVIPTPEEVAYYIDTGTPFEIHYSSAQNTISEKAALDVYLGFDSDALVVGDNSPTCYQLTDAYFGRGFGPMPVRRDDDSILRAWFITNATSREALNKMAIGLISLGALYPKYTP